MLDATTLAAVGSLPGPTIFDVFVMGSHVYVSRGVERPGDTYFLARSVTRYDAVSLTQTRVWDFVWVPSWVVVSRDGSSLHPRAPFDSTLAVSID